MLKLTTPPFFIFILLMMAVTACRIPEAKIVVKSGMEEAARNCDARGKCIVDPKGLVLYNPDVVTENKILKQPHGESLVTQLLNFVSEPKLLVASDKLEPLIRGVALVKELEPCDSPKRIEGSNPTIGKLRQLREGRYKACLAYVGEGLVRRVLALEAIDVDITPPEVDSNGVASFNISPVSATLSWSKSADNLTLDGNLSYKIYTSSSDPLTSIDAVRRYGNLYPGRLLGGTSYSLNNLNEKTRYHVAVVVSDEAGNESLVGHTNFLTPPIDVTPPSVIISSNLDPGPTNLTAIILTLKISEPVSDFTIDDVNVVGGVKGEFLRLADDIYTLQVTATVTGSPVTATVPAGAARDAAGNESQVSNLWSLVINGAVATPVFSVAAGAYGPAQSVTISTETAGATIYYTTNGSTPTTSSSVYSSAITVSSSMTIKAFATRSTYSDSSVASASYTINGAVATPTFSVAAGTYTSAQTVALSTTTASANIYYTTNGSTPTTSSSLYSSPISVSSTTTIKAFATKVNYSDSTLASAIYTINLGPPPLETLISTPAQLLNVANCLSCNYRVTANLDMTGVTWTPIDLFSGTFDGDGYLISNITINTSADASGLFANLSAGAVVKNVHIRNISITSSGIYAGGIAGTVANGALITDSSSTGTITLSTSNTSTANVGGLVAGVHGVVRRSWTSVNVSTTGYNYCHAGGAFAWIQSTATVSDIYATGSAYATCTIGNIASGGLIGTCIGKIINSYSSGASDNLSHSHNEGGMVGFISGCTATNSYWNTTTSGRTTSRIGTALSDTSMKTQSSFSGWDFTTTWEMAGGDGVGMPIFRAAARLNGPATIYATATSSTSVTLNIYAPTATEMYITNTAGCGVGGTWEAKASTKSWTLVNSGDGTGTVYARFRNGSAISNCVSHRVSVTATSLTSEGTSCASIRTSSAGRMSGVYLIDPDGAGVLGAESHFCNMDYTGGGWTLVTKTFADNTDITNTIPSTAEYLSSASVGLLTNHKYILGNDRQGFANWGAVVNGTGLNPINDFNGNLQKFTNYVGGSTARGCNWVSGSGEFVIATTSGGACLKFAAGANNSWMGASDGSSFAAIWMQGSYYNLGADTVYPPFNIYILNGADNDYCSIMQNGTITFGHGYTCRKPFLGSTAVTQSDYIEVYAK